MPKTQKKKEPVYNPVNAAIEAIRDKMHDECKDLQPAQFKEVLVEISADIDGHLESLKEEGEEED